MTSARAFRLGFGCALAIGAGVANAQFAPGELLLVSNAIGTGTGCGTAGIARINTTTWNVSLVTALPSLTRACYDPYRGAVIVTYVNTTAEAVASTGARTLLGAPGTNIATLVASAGDGRIYTWSVTDSRVRYVDAANVLHTLMDATGSTPYATTGNVGAMWYDHGTNALFFAALVPGDLTQVTRVPLNAAGTMLSGAAASTTFDASAGQAGEYPVGFSAGPGGLLFLKIDDNSGAAAARMRLIDPVTLTVSSFATSSYFGVGGEVAGAYVPAIGAAVALDSLNDVLRIYHFGESGAGSTPATTGNGVSSCGSGEVATFVLATAARCPADLDDGSGSGTPDAAVDINDLLYFLAQYEAGTTGADLDNGSGNGVPDGAVDINDLLYFLTRYEGGC